ncbi:hypothetical protein BGZ65_008370, partial [Modicella reniformis]
MTANMTENFFCILVAFEGLDVVVGDIVGREVRLVDFLRVVDVVVVGVVVGVVVVSSQVLVGPQIVLDVVVVSSQVVGGPQTVGSSIISVV